MKTQRKIIYSVIEFMSGFVVTDDSPFDEQLIADKIDDVRATLIKQEWNDKKSINDLYFQEYEVDIKVREIIDRHNQQNIIQFTVEFPELLAAVQWDNIKYLGKKDLSKRYNRRNLNGFMNGQHRRYSSNEVDYVVTGPSKALIRNEREAKDIVTIALFKNPSDVSKSLDVIYPVPDVTKLEMIVKQELSAALGIKSDEDNDSRHNQEQVIGQK